MRVRTSHVIPMVCAFLVFGAVYAVDAHRAHLAPITNPVALAPTQTTTTTPPTVTATSTIGLPRTKTNGCILSVLPDAACTPGAIFPTATKDQICVSGYTATVRDVPTSEKNAVFEAYGIISHPTGAYEVDHFIPLEIGGSNDIANLWPEPATPVPGFHQKDKVENELHQLVCNGTISLAEAQRRIATNWLAEYQRLTQN